MQNVLMGSDAIVIHVKIKILWFMLLRSFKSISCIIYFILYHPSCDKLDLDILISSSYKNQLITKENRKLIAFVITSPPSSICYLSMHRLLNEHSSLLKYLKSILS